MMSPRLLSDTGRSMVEMLGVLAIIGVLSVAGMAGYSYALVKYKANETMDELNKRSVLHATQLLQDGVPADGYLSQREFGDNTILGYGVEAKASVYENEFEITLRNYPSEVCRDILKNYTIPIEIIVGNTRYNPESDNDTICGDEIAPDTVFVYTADLDMPVEGTAEYPYEGTYGLCEPGIEFKSGSTCYPCNEEDALIVQDDEEYSLCAACGRSVFEVGSGDSYKDSNTHLYCTPACRSGEVFHMGQKKCVTPPCRTNADCSPGKYCKLDSGQNSETCLIKPDYGTCETPSGRKKTVDGVTYILSSVKMNWWSAQNFCAALNAPQVSVTEFECGYDFTNPQFDMLKKNGYCNVDETITKGTLSPVMQAWMTQFGCYGAWFSQTYNDCYAMGTSFCTGEIGANTKNDTKYWVGAFCRLSS